MQHLGAEVRELCGLFERNSLHAEGVGTDAWVSCHDAVDVGPNLNCTGVQSAADERGGVVGTASAQGGGDAGSVAPMKPPMTGV